MFKFLVLGLKIAPKEAPCNGYVSVFTRSFTFTRHLLSKRVVLCGLSIFEYYTNSFIKISKVQYLILINSKTF